MKDEIRKLKVLPKYAEKILIEAGYERHWKGNGYIRDLYNKKRWHAFIKGDEIIWHLDRTNDSNKHYVEKNWLRMHSIERKRLKNIWRKYDPAVIEKREEKARKRKTQLRTQYAPNLMELQKHI